MYIYYVYKPRKSQGGTIITDGYVGQDSGDNSSFSRMIEHAKIAYAIAPDKRDGAANIMRKYGLSGAMYRFYFDNEHYGLGDKAFAQFSEL